ncbi:hypothetical protein [Taklimakanibacter lacteus]|uniref:hypothetical protein n=1 Tax=Taklimakanibacter lacteus TaxID=2268456 RepID=UPI000E6676A3
MANLIRAIGVAAIFIGLVLLFLALLPLVQGRSLAILNSFLLTQGVAALSAGIITLGIGQLIVVNERLADNLENFVAHVRGEDSEQIGAPPREPPREAFANVPSYDPRRDPKIVKEGSYRSHTVLTLEDGSVVIETPAGWKRFRSIRDFERLVSA